MAPYTLAMPDPEFTSYDRDMLYEQVWAEPVRDLGRLRCGPRGGLPPASVPLPPP